MSQAASQADAFYREVAGCERVWTVRDSAGFPAPHNSEGARSTPFWSSRERVDWVVARVPAYRGFEPYELTWEQFRDKWLVGLSRDGLLVGINWSGPMATGYDVKPAAVRKNIEHHLNNRGEPGG